MAELNHAARCYGKSALSLVLDYLFANDVFPYRVEQAGGGERAITQYIVEVEHPEVVTALVSLGDWKAGLVIERAG
jgi:hypothetical protein